METEISNSSEQTIDYDDIAQRYDIIEKSDVTLWHHGKEFISFKLEYCGDLSSGKAVTAVIKTEPPIYLNDYYWSHEDYCTYLIKTGFKNCMINEPLAIGDEFPWIHEKSYPPYYIIEAKNKYPK